VTHAAAFFLPMSPHCTKYGSEAACVTVIASLVEQGYDPWPPAAQEGRQYAKGATVCRWVVQRDITTNGNAE